MRRLLTLSVLFLVAACQQAPSSHTFRPVRFQDSPPIQLNVREVVVVNEASSGLNRNDVSGDMPFSFEDMIRQWSSDRLQARGTTGRVEIVINEANITEVPLPVTKGFKGAFTKEQSERYDSKLSATLRIYTDASVVAMSDAQVTVNKSRSMREDSTIALREQLLYDISKEMMVNFDTEMTRQINQGLNNFRASY